MRPALTLTILPVTALSLLVTLAYLGGLTGEAPWWSGSPLNEGPLGTSLFVEALEDSGFTVVLGGPEDARRLFEAGLRPLYIVVSPDRPVDSSVASEIASLLNSGLLAGLLVADETGRANTLLEAVSAPRVAGPLEGVLGASCPWWNGPVSKPGLLEGLPPGWEALCTHEKGLLAAAGWAGDARVVVVADSSIFTNFMIAGTPPFKPSREAALRLADEAAAGSKAAVVDVTAHAVVYEQGPLYKLATLALRLAAAAPGLALSSPGAAAALASLAALTIALSAPKHPAWLASRPESIGLNARRRAIVVRAGRRLEGV